MRSRAACYDELRGYLDTVPLVDCHDHSGACGPKHDDAIHVVAAHYFLSDLHSASSDQEIAVILDKEKSLEERWPLFEKAWRRSQYTGYAHYVKLALKEFYGEDEVTLDALKRISTKMLDFEDAAFFESFLEKANIAVRLVDVWPDIPKVMDKSLALTPRAKLVISLPGFHAIRNYKAVQDIAGFAGRHVTSLDEYLDVCRTIFEGHKDFGAVAFKDQSAYTRTLDYGNPTRAEAEAVFNHFMEDPRRTAEYMGASKVLDDYLFHEFMRMARELDLPVQLHTGHMAGIRNDISKANAIHLRSVLELHTEVRFDLFHANWPFDDELLFLCKNYPNVAIDFCWANIVDPIYCQDLFRRALSSVPHGKIHAYGSDFPGCADLAWAHATMARDNIAIALADMVDMDYIGLDDAKEIARAWMFDNPKAFFRLDV